MDGKRVWKQALIPDWEVDNKLHPPAQPAGEGMMWRYSDKDGRKEWTQEGIGDWYADSANHPPTEYAGNGLSVLFLDVGTATCCTEKSYKDRPVQFKRKTLFFWIVLIKMQQISFFDVTPVIL